MIRQFEHLKEDEIDLLYMVPVWVTILIAGADDKIDKRELRGAVELAKSKREGEHELTREYFAEIARTFESNLKGYITLLSQTKKERNEIIIQKLSQLNDIFPKLDRSFTIQLYKDFREFAVKVAEASGGIFGHFSISDEEAEFLDLDMIQDPSKV